MASYQDLIQQIESLQKKAEELKQKEISQIIEDINQKIALYHLRPEDLKFGDSTGKAPVRKIRGTVAAKYRDQASGQTWTGRGRLPRWLVEAEKHGQPRHTFLIG